MRARRWILVLAAVSLIASACTSGGETDATRNWVRPPQENPLLEARAPGSADVDLGIGRVGVVNTTIPGPGTEDGGEFGTGTAAFHSYPAPRNAFPDANGFANETSIGVNHNTNAAMFLMTLNTARVIWDDTTDPPTATWTNVSVPLTHRQTNDPILWTDRVTGRTFVVQLHGGGSLIAYTDDDGATWTNTVPATVAPSFDHEQIGGGPYAAGGTGGPLTDYPHNVYYCAQGIVVSQCSRSDTGGLTWGPPLVMNNLTQCGGLHGDPVVHPLDGSVWVPHKSCTGGQGVRISRDNGLTWTTSQVPGTQRGGTDPQLTFDRAGNAYFAAESGGTLVVSVSTDSGGTWSAPVNVGAPAGIRNTVFPLVTAGDDGRAAAAWYGTTTAGAHTSESFTGDWNIYAAFTYDGGENWETVQVTPSENPVQRGCITTGLGSPCRNLLDFQGIDLDRDGRVLIGYADGCIFPCDQPNGTPASSRASFGTIARQTTGLGLFAG